jgi:hypothetical protein
MRVRIVARLCAVALTLAGLAVSAAASSSSTALSSSSLTISYGDTVTFTAVVSSEDGTPSGTVTFMDGATPLGGAVTLNNGVAMMACNTLLPGVHSITAVYSGDDDFDPSTSDPLAETVNPGVTSTVLTSSGTANYGQAVTLTATVSASAGTPTGVVVFLDGSTVICTVALIGNTAVDVTSTLTAGSHAITASYGGDSNFAPSTSLPLTQVINPAGTTTTASVPASLGYGLNATLTATVAGAGGTPTGTVTFMDGTTTLGTGTLDSGTATYAWTLPAIGSHTVSAVYGGDANYGGSTSAAAPLTVIPSVLTWHYDNQRTGSDSNETVLNTTNVSKTTFGKLFTQNVDGYIVGQPLYFPNVAIPGLGTHNVVYVATMHDSVYAFDADNATGANAAPLWQVSLLPPGATSYPATLQGCKGTTGWTEVGVVSTGALDPVTETLYVVSKTLENGIGVQRLHALDMTTGAEKFGGSVVISASYSFGGSTYQLNTKDQMNRPGLLLQNGQLYIAFGSNGCNKAAQGWVLAYDPITLLQLGAFDDEPGGSNASIWQKGGGLSADSDGNVYADTGEGTFIAGVNFNESVMKLTLSGGGLGVTDWFTPYDQDYLKTNDKDFIAPVLILPDQAGPYPHLAITTEKVGNLYLLNRDNMGEYCFTCIAGDTQIVQELPAAAGNESNALVYWNGYIFTSGAGTPIYAFSLTNGQLSTTPVAQSGKITNEHPPLITSNGANNGILWQLSGNVLRAYNALTFKSLYTSSQASGGRDKVPTVAHFAAPIAVNGKLYIGTKTNLVAYGLLGQ